MEKTVSESPSPEIVVEVYGISDVGSKRKGNEDAFVAVDLAGPRFHDSDLTVRFAPGPHGCLVAVSDGMGGAAAGEVASAVALECAERSLRQALPTEPLEALDRAVAAAQAGVLEAAGERGRRGMGATLVAALFLGSRAYVASVGDSRAYFARRGAVLQVTTDHSLSQLLAQSGAEGQRAAEGDDFRNVVLQAIGQQGEVECSLGLIDLELDDVLLLCSDGLTGYVSGDEILGVLSQSWTLQAAGRRLVFLANRRGGADNITAVLAKVVGGPAHTAASARSAFRSVREPDLMRLANRERK